MYRIKIDLTYTTVNNATTATTNINNALIAAGRPERATRNNTVVYLLITGVATEAEARELTNNLTPAWGATARSGGKVSTVRTNDTD